MTYLVVSLDVILFFNYLCYYFQSQEDLRILDEGELEENIKKVTEQEERAIRNPLPQFKVRKKFPLVDSSESKNSSRTASTQGSDPLTRKEFLDIDGEQATSKDSSIHSSKGSLGSSDGSEPSSSKRREEERLMKDDLYNGDSHYDRQDEVCLASFVNVKLGIPVNCVREKIGN